MLRLLALALLTQRGFGIGKLEVAGRRGAAAGRRSLLADDSLGEPANRTNQSGATGPAVNGTNRTARVADGARTNRTSQSLSDATGPTEQLRCEMGEKLVLPLDAVVVDAWYGDPNDTSKRIQVTEMVRKQHSSGNAIIWATDELYGESPARLFTTVLEVSFSKVTKHQADESKSKAQPGVTMMVQVGNHQYWQALKSCASNVSQAFHRAGEGFELFLALTDEVDKAGASQILADARSTFGQSNVRSLVAENRGADIGLMLRQLKKLGSEPQDDHYDLFLKVHSKSDDEKRGRWLDDLCGSVNKVTDIHSSFRRSKRLGMVGPATEVIQYPHRNAEFLIWGEDDIEAMERTWKMMQPCVPFRTMLPKARIIAGSFYWTRQEAVLNRVLLQTADELLESMPTKYITGTTATTAHALERLIPTMSVYTHHLNVVSSDSLPKA